MDVVSQMTLPPRLYQQIQTLIADGWFRDENDLIAEAVRRYLEARHPEIMEQFIKEDVKWGLYGRD